MGKLGRVWPIKIQTITYWAGRSTINHKSSHIGLDSAQPPRLGWVNPDKLLCPCTVTSPKHNYPVTVLMHSNRVIISSCLQNVNCARSTCKNMKLETNTRGIGLPGMEALSFTVLVAHGGVGVAAAGCGGKRCFFFFSPLFWFVSVFLCFFCSLSSLSFSLSFTLLYFFVSVLLSLLSSLAAFFVSYAVPPSVFSSLRSPSPCFFFFPSIRFLLWLL